MLPESGSCSTCKWGLRLRFGIILKLKCDVGVIEMEDLPNVVLSFSGSYFLRGKNSVSSLTLGMNGTFEDEEIPPGTELSVSVTHKKPIQLSNPFSFESCNVKVGTETCSCSICGNSTGIFFY